MNERTATACSTVIRVVCLLIGAVCAGALAASCSGSASGVQAAAVGAYPYVARSGSMEQSIHAGQTVMARPVTDYRGRVGGIVLFRGPRNWQSEASGQAEFLKRVIAVGGQTVQCCDPRGRVLVDGQPLDEPYVYYVPESEAGPRNQADFGPVRVPDGELWVMGDSRNNSADSRVPQLGPVPEKSVTAIVSAARR